MKNILLILLLICVFSFNSCDILRNAPFEVVSWTPGSGFHSEPEKITVSLEFSNEPDRASAERNFSLSGDEGQVRGNFLWSGKTLTFLPLTQLEKNTDYTIKVSAEAHDTEGLSMDEAFLVKFTTRLSDTRPFLLSCFPEMYSETDDQRTEVKLYFSVPVPLKSLYGNVSFSPSISGSWRLEEDGRLAVFTPSELWTYGSRYEIRVSSSFTDNNKMSMGTDFLSIFAVGADREAPYLVNAMRITDNGSVFPLIQNSQYSGAAEIGDENTGWEKNDRFSLVFSRPVDSISVKNNLSTENGPDTVMKTLPGFNTEFIFSFETIPDFSSRFTLRIKPGIKDIRGNESREEYVYRILADGIRSKPPVLRGIRIPMVPGNKTSPDLKFFGDDSLFEIIPITDSNYPPDEKGVETWVELYFETAEGADIDSFSLMELFRTETSNNVISFSPRLVKTNAFTVYEPYRTDFKRAEITGYLSNTANFGIIYFRVAAGLQDTLGNKNEKTQTISIIK